MFYGHLHILPVPVNYTCDYTYIFTQHLLWIYIFFYFIFNQQFPGHPTKIQEK